MRGMMADRVGMVTATAADCTATSPSSNHGLLTFSTAWASSDNVTSHMRVELTSSRRRRSSRSASAPPQSEKINNGTRPPTPRTPTQALDFVIAYIWTGTATAVSWVPKNDVADPTNIRRYAGWRSGRVSIATRRQPCRPVAYSAVEGVRGRAGGIGTVRILVAVLR